LILCQKIFFSYISQNENTPANRGSLKTAPPDEPNIHCLDFCAIADHRFIAIVANGVCENHPFRICGTIATSLLVGYAQQILMPS
jgi:hypothetical protein